MKRLFNICLVIALHAIILTSCDLLFPYSVEDAPAAPIVEPDTTSVTLNGKFSIGEGKLVQFSPGNLQYRASTDEWRFAPDQTECIGLDNENISSSYSGWIDLFGWGTGKNPTRTGEVGYSVYADWGINKIGNDNSRTWRALTKDEWEYLLTRRLNADKLNGAVRVELEKDNSILGWVLLPDAWVCPAGFTFTEGFTGEYSGNVFLLDEWKLLEASGAVFLPAAGDRSDDLIVYGLGNFGYYWSATGSDNYSTLAYELYFESKRVSMTISHRYTGLSVRLVKDL